MELEALGTLVSHQVSAPSFLLNIANMLIDLISRSLSAVNDLFFKINFEMII